MSTTASNAAVEERRARLAAHHRQQQPKRIHGPIKSTPKSAAPSTPATSPRATTADPPPPPQNRTSPLSSRLRDALREPHPFARKPATLQPYPPPWLSVYAKRTLRTFGVLVPLAVVVFGWPFAGQYLVNWSNGVYASSGSRADKQQQQQQGHEPVKSHKIARRAMLQQGPERVES